MSSWEDVLAAIDYVYTVIMSLSVQTLIEMFTFTF